MTQEELHQRISDILSEARWGEFGWDDELAHSLEDELHKQLLKDYLPQELLDELKRLDKADFTRYCS